MIFAKINLGTPKKKGGLLSFIYWFYGWENKYRVCLPLGGRKTKKGQVILEILWLALFAFAFLTMLAFLYEKGKKEIELSRAPYTKKPVCFKKFPLSRGGKK